MRFAASRAQRGDDACGEVLDVDEAPRLGAVAGDRQRLPAERLGDERRDDRGRTRAGPVRNAEAEDRVLEAVQLAVRAHVHLARDLRRRVEVLRQRQRRVLVDLLGPRRVAVDPDRAGVHEARHAFLPRRLEQHVRAAGVHLLGPGRILRDLVDVGHRGQVDDHVAARHGRAHGILVAQIAKGVLERMTVQVGRVDEIEVPCFVSRRHDLVDDVRADETGPACDENSQGNTSSPAAGW